MMRRNGCSPGIVTALYSLVFLVGCTTSLKIPRFHVEQKEWNEASPGGVQFLTDHFDLRVSSRDPPLVDLVAPFMEATFMEYRKIVPPPPDRTDQERMVVYLFGDRKQWARFTELRFPRQAPIYLHIHAGGYADYQSATAVTYDIGRDITLALLAHEGFHQYLARYFPEQVVPWINEGLATQWEAFDLKDGYPVYTPERNFLRRNSLREALSSENMGLIDLSRLLTMNAGEAVVKTGQSSRTYYAQVWSLVLYLRKGAEGAYAQRFDDLLGDIGTERFDDAVRLYRRSYAGSEPMSAGEAAFRHYIMDDLDAFLADYEEFARALVY